MSLQVSTGYKAQVALMFKAAFDGAVIRVFSAPQPDIADMAQPDTLLGTVTLAGSGLVFDANGPYVQKPGNAAWVLNATTSGTAAWFRIALPSDGGEPSYSAPRIDGAAGLAGTAVELILPAVALVAGQAYPIDDFLYTLPPIIGA